MQTLLMVSIVVTLREDPTQAWPRDYIVDSSNLYSQTSPLLLTIPWQPANLLKKALLYY